MHSYNDCHQGRNFVNWGPNANIDYGVQWRAVISEIGRALGMASWSCNWVFYW